MKNHTLVELFSAEAIARRVDELGAAINTLYGDEPLVVICILKGGFMFFSDLVRRLKGKPELDFVRLASYGSGTNRSQHIAFTKDVEIALENKHVLFVEDIVDTGHTMHFLMHQMQARGAKSLRLAALVDKYERREVPVTVDFAGFSLSDGFIVGYGLDYAEHYRELPGIYTLSGVAG